MCAAFPPYIVFSSDKGKFQYDSSRVRRELSKQDRHESQLKSEAMLSADQISEMKKHMDATSSNPSSGSAKEEAAPAKRGKGTRGGKPPKVQKTENDTNDAVVDANSPEKVARSKGMEQVCVYFKITSRLSETL